MASLDAAAAEFAAKALGTFWTLFFAASVVADLDLLPGVSARLRAFAARGKQADAEPSSPSAPAGLRAEAKWWVPHKWFAHFYVCLLYTSPSPRDATLSRMPSSA